MGNQQLATSQQWLSQSLQSEYSLCEQKYLVHKLTGQHFSIHKIGCRSPEESNMINQTIKKYSTSKCKSISQLKQHFHKTSKSYCSQSENYYFLFHEHGQNTLKQQYLSRKYYHTKFSQQQIISALSAIISGLKQYNQHFGRPHRHVILQNVCIEGITNRIYMKDPWLSSQPQMLHGSFNNLTRTFPSPQKLNSIYFCKDQIYDEYLSNLFSVGMIGLQMYYLQNPHTIYTKDKNIQFSELQKLINSVQHNKLQIGLRILLNVNNHFRKNIFTEWNIISEENKFLQIKNKSDMSQSFNLYMNQQNSNITYEKLKQSQIKSKKVHSQQSQLNYNHIPRSFGQNVNHSHIINNHHAHNYQLQPQTQYHSNPQHIKNQNVMAINQHQPKNQQTHRQNLQKQQIFMPFNQTNIYQSQSTKPNNHHNQNQFFKNTQQTQHPKQNNQPQNLNQPHPIINKSVNQNNFKKDSSTHIASNYKLGSQQPIDNKILFYTNNQPVLATINIPPQYKQQVIQQYNLQTANEQKTNFIKHTNNKVYQVQNLQLNSQQIEVKKQRPKSNNINFKKNEENKSCQMDYIKKKVYENSQNYQKLFNLNKQNTNTNKNMKNDNIEEEKIEMPVSSIKLKEQFQKVVDEKQNNQINLNQHSTSAQQLSKQFEYLYSSKSPKSPPILLQTENKQFQIPNRRLVIDNNRYNSTIPEQNQQTPQRSQESLIFEDNQEYVVEQYETGSKYQGFKIDGMRNGNGKFFYQDGGHYEGQWKKNKMHGWGRLYYEGGRLAYQGYWRQDQFHGYGKVYNDSPVELQSGFNYSNFDELDDYWVYYEGMLVSDVKQGRGKIKLTNGEIFEGDFHQDKVQGFGTYTTIDGKQIEGIWRQSKLIKILSN